MRQTFAREPQRVLGVLKMKDAECLVQGYVSDEALSYNAIFADLGWHLSIRPTTTVIALADGIPILTHKKARENDPLP